jgi:hypothetical protein
MIMDLTPWLARTGGLLAVVAAAAVAGAPGAGAGAGGDIREFAVGLTVDELPAEGYLGFKCGHNGGKPGKDIAGWGAFADCPADGDGLHEVAFQYDDSDVRYEDLEGTAIAGHQVLISLLFDDQGVVEGIRVFTDPFARSYEKRRAHILSEKVKARFGLDGWDCRNEEPGPGESEIGGLFIKERCRKDLGNRVVDLYTQFYRHYGTGGEEIVNSTSFEIRRQPAQS